ncbi:hypothetical protein, partial [Borreliella garinii]|uniref:hypothetical protein n=1 Tax=Borreliella garinii TaxID=29519 RepID=UPI001AEF5B05
MARGTESGVLLLAHLGTALAVSDPRLSLVGLHKLPKVWDEYCVAIVLLPIDDDRKFLELRFCLRASRQVRAL